MSTALDHRYVQRCITQAWVRGCVLEIGARLDNAEEGNSRPYVEGAGLDWSGLDLAAGPDVTYVADIGDRAAVDAVARTWDTVLVLNVLEHVYDPVASLTNVARLVDPGGHVVVITPTVWPLHDYPMDCWRPLPGFYREWAARNSFTVVDLSWLTLDRFIPVDTLRRHGVEHLPSKVVAGSIFGGARAQLSRVINRALALPARQFHFPYVAIGVVLRQS